LDTPLTALLVDDEMLARENLKMMLEDYCPEIQVIGSASTVDEARTQIAVLKPQVVFLDIRMPSGAEGFELLESIEEKNFQVVFVTAFKDYAVRALNAHAIHYVLKPIDVEDLKHAVLKLVEYHEAFAEHEPHFEDYIDSVKNLTESILSKQQHKRVTLYHSKGFKIVDQEDIIRLEADGNCTAFYFKDGSRYLDTKTLKTYEEILTEPSFIRVHKSHIINLGFLKEYLSQDGSFAILENEDKVPISRSKLSHFLTLAKQL
jgi:two-component system LytT family response regulator